MRKTSSWPHLVPGPWEALLLAFRFLGSRIPHLVNGTAALEYHINYTTVPCSAKPLCLRDCRVILWQTLKAYLWWEKKSGLPQREEKHGSSGTSPLQESGLALSRGVES